MSAKDPFERSIREQFERNQRRTPAERMQALFDLLDTIETMRPQDVPACERRRTIQRWRRHEREQLVEQLRRLRIGAEEASDCA